MIWSWKELDRTFIMSKWKEMDEYIYIYKTQTKWNHHSWLSMFEFKKKEPNLIEFNRRIDVSTKVLMNER